MNRFKCEYSSRYLVLGENFMECHLKSLLVIWNSRHSCFMFLQFFCYLWIFCFCKVFMFLGFFLVFGLGFLCVYKWNLSWFGCGVLFQGVSVLCVVNVMTTIVVGTDINVHNIENVWLNLFKNILRLHDTPLSSLMDSTTNRKVKTTEEERVEVCSLVRNTLGVEGCVVSLGWG